MYKNITKIAIALALTVSGGIAYAQAAYFNVNLNTGSALKTEVVKLQNFLIGSGYLGAGYNTGVYGSLTQKAVADFQKANNITPASGYFGPLTRTVANSLYSGSQAGSQSSAPAVPASIKIESVTDNSQAGASVLVSTRTIRWSSTNYPAAAGVNINLLRKVSSSPLSYELVRVIATDSPNDGTETWSNLSTDTGELYVEIACSSTYKFSGGCNFGSAPFRIK